MLTRRIFFLDFLSRVQNRGIATTKCCEQTNLKQVKVLKKIMVGREKGKRRWVYNEGLPKMENPTKLSSTTNQGKHANRRVTVLNKLFMQNVTDLMATDLFAEELFGYGLQISSVKIDDDFKKLNIFWIATEMGGDGRIEKILKSIAGPLRHELSVLRLMGEVPQINFVKDHTHMKTAEIDAVLKGADFGEDFVPTDPTLFVKTEPILEMKIADDVKLKLSEIDLRELNEELEDDEEIRLPRMRHDSLGLDHAKIMSKIVANLNKSRQAWETYEQEQAGLVTTPHQTTIATPHSISEEVGKLRSEADMRENFIKFLEERQWRRRNTPERKRNRKYLEHVPDDESYVYTDPIPDGDYLDDEEAKR